MSARPNSAGDPSEREVFLGALERPEGTERAAYLDIACRGNASFRASVEALLREHAAAESFLETPAMAGEGSLPRAPGFGPGGTALVASGVEKPGDRIGRYRLLQQVGEGGCGVVYMAEQEEPVRRRVALKVIKLGMDTKNVIARFEAERQALAMMEHENIARVLDAGATEAGRPYFVMELVRGVRITDYCNQHKLSPTERLELLIQVCQAVQHAHQKGIIHRDLKPSNILVTLHDGRPVPKVIDFGIAKATEQRLTEKTLFTAFAAFIGTPAYMSPEQAEMSGLDIDTRTDVYSLGVLLYELLTGRTPFDAEELMRGGLDECRRTIRERDPERPSTRLGTLLAADLTTTASERRTDAPRLIHLLRGDLDWVVMKCLEKDRARRYATANALALDLQRYLENEPVLARPPSNLYQLQKMLRRHRLVVGAVGGIAASLLIGSSISVWQAVRATRAEAAAQTAQKEETRLRKQAEKDKAAAHLNEYVADMGLAQLSIAGGNYGRAVQLLDKHRPKSKEPDLRGFEWRYLRSLSRGDSHDALPTQASSILSLAVSPDGRLLAIGLWDQIRVFDLATRTPVADLARGGMSVAFLDNGRSLASASRSSVRIWNTADWTERRPLPETMGPIAASPDGSLLAAQSPGGVRVWNTTDWTVVRVLRDCRGLTVFSPDGQSVAVESRDGLSIHALRESRAPVLLQDTTNLFFASGPLFPGGRSLVFSRDARQVVAPLNKTSERGVFAIGIWDTATGEIVASMPTEAGHAEHTSFISALALSPDGQTLASASFDHSIRLWDLANRKVIRAVQGHVNEVWATTFSPDGRELLSGGKDGSIYLWPTVPQRKEELLPEGWVPVCFSADSRSVAAINSQSKLALFNLATREPDQEIQLELARLPQGGPAGYERRGPPPDRAGPPEDHAAKPPGEPRGPAAGPHPPFDGGRPDGRRFSPKPSFAISSDLRTLAQSAGAGTILMLDTATRESLTLQAGGNWIDSLTLSPDGKVLITGGRGQELRWWEPSVSTNCLTNIDAARCVFAPDGRRLVTLGPTNIAQLWDVDHRTPLTRITLDPAPGYAVALSPDHKTLVTTASFEVLDNAVYLWNTDTGELLGTCTGHKQPVVALAFAPDGLTLASSGTDSTIKFWNLATRQELLSIQRPGSTASSLVFSPDGRYLVGSTAWPMQTTEYRCFLAPSFKETDARR